MKTKSILFLVLIFLIASCSYKYRYIYDTYVVNANAQKSSDSADNQSQDTSLTNPLVYQDSILKFTFAPKPNGIFFQIENLSAKNIFLLWDESYFIEPNNNSAKALNTDILNTKDEIVNKQNNESIIPRNGIFSRFTTSSKNIVSVEKFNFSTYYISPNITLQNNYYNEIYLHNPYWITFSKIAYDNKTDAKIKHNSEMSSMKEKLENNNHLGLGFTFRTDAGKIDYNFKIKIDKVIVYRYSSETYYYERTDTINLSK